MFTWTLLRPWSPSPLRFIQLRQPRSRALPTSSAAARGELGRDASGLRGADRGAGQSEGSPKRESAGAALRLHHMQGEKLRMNDSYAIVHVTCAEFRQLVKATFRGLPRFRNPSHNL